MEGFCLYRKDRPGRVGGGLVLYINDNIQSTEVTYFQHIDFKQSVWCRLSIGGESLLVGLIYRSPSSPRANDDKLLEILEVAASDRMSSKTLIVGDFNHPGVDFDGHGVKAGDGSVEAQFFSKTQDLFLVQHVTEATRFRQGQRASILDYIFTDEDNVVDNIQYEVPLGKSDHCCLTWVITVSKAESNQSSNRLNYWKGNYEAIRTSLAEIDWVTEFAAFPDVADKWTYLRAKVMDAVEKYVPRRKPFQVKKKNEWVSRTTIKKMRDKHKAWKRYRNSPSSRNYEKFKHLRNEATASVRSDQDNYRKNLLKSFKGNPKKFFGYMRSRQTVKTAVTTLKTSDGRLTQECLRVSLLMEVWTPSMESLRV